MIKQAKDFKAEREHCYTTLAQLEIDLQQLQVQNHVAEQSRIMWSSKLWKLGPSKLRICC